MREESSLWDKIVFNYVKPLLDISMKERICFEQYGVLPDKLKIDHEIAKVEQKINYHMKKQPDSKYNVLKGMLEANKWKYTLFIFSRFGISILNLMIPLLLGELIEYIEEDTSKLAEHKTATWAVQTTLTIMLLSSISYVA